MWQVEVPHSEQEMKMTLEQFKTSLAQIDKGLRPFPATAQVRGELSGLGLAGKSECLRKLVIG